MLTQNYDHKILNIGKYNLASNLVSKAFNTIGYSREKRKIERHIILYGMKRTVSRKRRRKINRFIDGVNNKATKNCIVQQLRREVAGGV